MHDLKFGLLPKNGREASISINGEKSIKVGKCIHRMHKSSSYTMANKIDQT